MKVRYSYLQQQFADPEPIFKKIRQLLKNGSFTLGEDVKEFEKSFAALIGTKWAVGVGSGTDAIILALKAIGVSHDDEVITAANTFIATAGAINAVGAKPVFVDVTSYFTINPDQIERKITKKTKAIIPVHLTGEPCDMTPIMRIAEHHGIPVIEDACQAIGAAIDGKNVGTFGVAGCFSLHPLKNLNVWGDGGIIVTNNNEVSERLRLLRNHGLKNRDEIEILGYNSRLDSLQAIVGQWLINQVGEITIKRIANAATYSCALQNLQGEIFLPPRRPNAKRVFHLYQFEVKQRDMLYKYLNDSGIEAKIHYPISLHLQKPFREMGYREGDFPEAEKQARHVLSLPVDQYLSKEEILYVVQTIEKFCSKLKVAV